MIILPGKPFVKFGTTLGGVSLVNSVPVATHELNLQALILVTVATTSERWQAALDAYLGFAPSPASSVPWAIEQDPTLGGTVDYAVPIQVSQYGLIDYAGQPYAGAHVDVEVVAA